MEISESKIREAAKSCPEAKRVLKVLFPEVFLEKEFDVRKVRFEYCPQSSCVIVHYDEWAVFTFNKHGLARHGSINASGVPFPVDESGRVKVI